MSKKQLPLTEKEIKVQMATGTLPPEMKIDPCRYKTPMISPGARKCFLCGEKCIKKGDEFYLIDQRTGGAWTFRANICMDCSFLSMQKIRRIIKENTPNKEKT